MFERPLHQMNHVKAGEGNVTWRQGGADNCEVMQVVHSERSMSAARIQWVSIQHQWL